MNMMDKCTNFHEHVDTPSGYMITQLIPARANELSKMANFVYNFV